MEGLCYKTPMHCSLFSAFEFATVIVAFSVDLNPNVMVHNYYNEEQIKYHRHFDINDLCILSKVA